MLDEFPRKCDEKAIICIAEIRDELRDDLSVCLIVRPVFMLDEFPRKRDEKAIICIAEIRHELRDVLSSYSSTGIYAKRISEKARRKGLGTGQVNIGDKFQTGGNNAVYRKQLPFM